LGARTAFNQSVVDQKLVGTAPHCRRHEGRSGLGPRPPPGQA
jgi:hypothetical protein